MAVQQPASHPDLFRIDRSEEAFASSLRAVKPFKAGETICFLTGYEPRPKSWSTVQSGNGPNDHIELNSDLVYINHSCEPNGTFDLSSKNRSEWQFRAVKDIAAGEMVTFFYPSTEWEMDQPFRCNCGTKTCLGIVSGAKNLTASELRKRGPINPHIWRLVEERDGNRSRL